MPKGIMTEYRLELAGLFIAVFSFLTVVGVVGVFFEESLPGYLSFLKDLTEPIGSWGYWLVVAGPIALVISIWWLYDFVKKTRELDDLIKTPSKAKFVRNLDDIEFLAWSLPQRYEDQVLSKKKEFGL
jgi:H+/Cl- antiporter ClcA